MSQFFYIHPDNPQPRLIKQTIEVLQKGGVIVYPTDSGYALGCLLDNKDAMIRICRIRQVDQRHNFTLVCRDLSELASFAHVDNQTFRLLKNNTPGHYTFILKASKEVPRRLMNEKRKTIGLRIPTNPIALAILAELNQPLMSSSLLIPDSDLIESDPEDIQEKLAKQVDLIIHGGYLGAKPTTVIDLTDYPPVIIRHGNGDVTPFIME